jgi:hypothetical protein
MSKIIKEIIHRGKSTLFGRPRASPELAKYLYQNGNIKITKLVIVRSPIEKSLQYVANLVTIGGWNNVKKNLGYDDIFHLGLVFELENGKKGILEKNHVIQINKADLKKKYEYCPINYEYDLTLNKLMENTIPLYKNLKEFYGYNGKTNNCQRFILSVLMGNHLLGTTMSDFILQNSKNILERNGILEGLLNIGTFLAEKGDILLHGGKISL